MTDLSQLQQRQVHLWFAVPEEVPSGRALDGCVALLDDEERGVAERFRLPALRHTYVVAHVLVRTCLSRYAPVDPAKWTFTRNRYGKPEISGPAAPPLRFNLSHTDGLVGCAVVLEHDIGVDVENCERKLDLLSVAESSFSACELSALKALPPEDQRKRFFDYWTLKEAYIKARGMGLSLPLEQFSFHFDRQAGPRIAFDPRMADEPRHWQFARLRPSSGHAAAVALRRGDLADYDIVAWNTVPLASCTQLDSGVIVG